MGEIETKYRSMQQQLERTESKLDVLAQRLERARSLQQKLSTLSRDNHRNDERYSVSLVGQLALISFLGYGYRLALLD